MPAARLRPLELVLLVASLTSVACGGDAGAADVGNDAASAEPTRDGADGADATHAADAVTDRDAGAVGDDADGGVSPEDAAEDAHDHDASGEDAGEADASAEDAGEADASAEDADAGEPTDGEADGSPGDASWGTCAVLGVAGTCEDTSVCAATPLHLHTPGYCPGPASVQCCTPYGLALCDPSIVRLPNAGNTTEAPGSGGCPAGMVRVTTFCVDQFEASLVKTSDGSSVSPYLNPGAESVRAVSVAGAVPQAYIDGDQAAAACANAGKRLCTDAEWLRACEGPSGTTYPYGDTLMLGVCNDHRDVHPAVEYFGTTASWIYSMIGDACLDQLPLGLEPTATRAGCVTADGAYDMMGNLHEWTADPNGTFRGGYFVDTVINGPGCKYVTTAHNTLHWDYSTGFRCCAD